MNNLIIPKIGYHLLGRDSRDMSLMLTEYGARWFSTLNVPIRPRIRHIQSKEIVLPYTDRIIK